MRISDRFRRCTILVVLFVVYTGCASPVPHVESQDAVESFELRSGKAFLWEVSRPGSAQVSAYLMGSVHLLDRPLSLGPYVARTFSRADALVVEINLTALKPEGIQDLVIRHGLMTPSEQLEGFLRPETLEQMPDYMDQQGLSPELAARLTRMKPGLIAMTLTELSVTAAGYQTALGVDRFFLDRAGAKQIMERRAGSLPRSCVRSSPSGGCQRC